jgi:hypothetical protein
MTTWKFLHIACMFAAVSIFVGQGWLSAAIESSGDLRAIRRTLKAERRFAPIGGALFGLGIVFGIVTAVTGDLDLTATWLLIAYGLVILVLVNNAVSFAPRSKRLAALVDASPGDEATPEIRAVIDARGFRAAAVVDLVLWLAIIYTMVTKPFS